MLPFSVRSISTSSNTTLTLSSIRSCWLERRNRWLRRHRKSSGGCLVICHLLRILIDPGFLSMARHALGMNPYFEGRGHRVCQFQCQVCRALMGQHTNTQAPRGAYVCPQHHAPSPNDLNSCTSHAHLRATCTHSTDLSAIWTRRVLQGKCYLEFEPLLDY
jgi:hypothetical protein